MFNATRIMPGFMLCLIALAPGFTARAAEVAGDTELMAAVRQNDVATVRGLLDKGSDPNVANAYGSTALLLAASQSGVGPAGKTATQVMQLLLQYGAIVNAQAGNGVTALIIAAGRGSVENVQLLLAAGAKPNVETKQGDSALLEATVHGYLKIVIMLLQAGADTNLKDANGQTPLMVAIRQAPRFSRSQSPYEVIVDALLKHGANSSVRDHNGQSPASLVAVGDKNVLIYPLLDHHADINIADPTAAGGTPIIIAARHGNTALVRALLRAHPDLTRRDNNGKTALQYARQSQSSEIAALLEQAGERK